MSTLADRLVISCLLLIWAAGSGSAQGTPEQPAGSGDAARPASHAAPQVPRKTMTLTFSQSGAGADDSETGAAGDPRALSGFHTDSDALLSFETRSKRTSLGLSARSVVRYDPARHALTTMRDQGAIEFSAAGSRTGFHATQSASYSPYYQLGALSDAPVSELTDTAQ
jgi:hypothetical protein